MTYYDNEFEKKRRRILGISGNATPSREASFEERRKRILARQQPQPINRPEQQLPQPIQEQQPKQSLIQKVGGAVKRFAQNELFPQVKRVLPISKKIGGEALNIAGQARQIEKQYIVDTAREAVLAAQGAAKLTPIYQVYRAATGNPMKPQEYVQSLLEAGGGALNVSWRMQPEAPLVGAGLNSWGAVRRYLQGKISAKELAKAPIEGINKQPGFGQIFTDNVKHAEAIDYLFMAGMFAHPFVKRKLGDLNLKADQIRKIKNRYGVGDNSSLGELQKAIKERMARYPEAFTANPGVDFLRVRKEISEDLNALKNTGALSEKYIKAHNFINHFISKQEPNPLREPIGRQIPANIPEKPPEKPVEPKPPEQPKPPQEAKPIQLGPSEKKPEHIYPGKDIENQAEALGSDQGGASEETLKQIGGEDYTIKKVSIDELRKNDEYLDEYLSKSKKPREFEGEPFAMPPVVSSDGEVIDGYNRIHQALVNGDKEIEIYQGIKKQKPVGERPETKTKEEFMKNSSPMQKARANKILDTKYHFGNKVKTEREFIQQAVKDGLEIRKKIHKLVGRKPKLFYEVVDKDGTMTDISKTAYNYAQYLREQATQKPKLQHMKLKDIDAEIRKIEPPTQKGDKLWTAEVGTFESLGETGGEIWTYHYPHEPTLEEIRRDVLKDYEDKKKDINKEVATGITIKTGLDDKQEAVIDKILKSRKTAKVTTPAEKAPRTISYRDLRNEFKKAGVTPPVFSRGFTTSGFLDRPSYIVASQHGVLTDGFVAIKDKDMVKQFVNNLTDKGKLSGATIKYYIKSEGENGKRTAEQVDKMLSNKNTVPITPIEIGSDSIFGGVIRFAVGDKSVSVSASKYSFIKKMFPDATFSIDPSNLESPLVASSHGKRVGLLMPIRIAEGAEPLKNVRKLNIIQSNGEGNKRNTAKQKNISKTGKMGQKRPRLAKPKPGKNVKETKHIAPHGGGKPGKRHAKTVINTDGLSQAQINNKIEELVKSKGDNSLAYTEAEKQLLQKYTGAGGLGKQGATGRGLLDEYYTPDPLVKRMWELVKPIIPDGGIRLLEPSAGIGGFIKYAPPKSSVTAFEINPTSATIIRILYPGNTNVFNKPFESLFVDKRGNKIPYRGNLQYDLVIGNPPYGEHRGKYLGLGEEPGISKYEQYFLKRGIDLLKDNGVLAYVMPSGFMKGPYSHAKREIAHKAELVDAYRLPNNVFGTTSIGTDILIFRKQKTVVGLKPLQDISNDFYFKSHPKKILGDVLPGKGNYGSDLVTGTLDEALRRMENGGEIGKQDKPDKITPGVTKIIDKEIGKENEARIKTPRKVTGKYRINSHKRDKTISLSNASPQDVDLWKHIDPFGRITDTDYLSKRLGVPNDPEGLKKINSPIFGISSEGIFPREIYYSGNIYEKLDDLERMKDNLSPEQYKRQKQGLLAVLPEKKTIKQIKLNPISKFVANVAISTGRTLLPSFGSYLRSLPSEIFRSRGISRWDIEGYLNGAIVNKGDRLLNQKVVRERRELAKELFNKFISEELPSEDVNKIEDAYNRQFNFYRRPDYKQIPLAAKLNATFKGSKLQLTDLQKEGASFLAYKGTGLLAYEVGLGKTLTAITALNEVMHKGWAKRPLIIVPNSVYSQWIEELTDAIPNVKINSLVNLGGKFKGDISKLKIDDGTISLITYEGMSKLGFRDETYDELTRDLGDVMKDIRNLTPRGEAKEGTFINTIMGKAIRGTSGNVFFEDLGFDHVTIDEVHNFKNIFSRAIVRGRTSNEYRYMSGSSSIRGVKAYLITQYILGKNGGRNVFALSATPFTNNPIEIYSILSLMGKKTLEKMGLQNMNDFMSMFVDLKSKFVVKANQSVKQEDVVENFTNLRQLQQVVTRYINFRTGEEVGIERPKREKRTIFLHPSPKQIDYITQAQDLFGGRGRSSAIVAITELQNITLSPYLSRYSEETPTYRQFVESSPKIKYAVDMVAENLKHKDVNQVIYMPRGVDYFPLLKQYLVKVKHIPDKKIGIIKGGMSIDAKAKIQNDFNAGKLRVLIGTEAIKEGINLQERSTDLFHLHLPWNPTDMLQIEGRIWRQGNSWRGVRIHYPLIENSVDSFIFQKLETKEKRIKNIWNYTGNEISVGDLDFENMKLDLITDPVIRTNAEEVFELSRINHEISEAKIGKAFLSRKIGKYNEAKSELDDVKGSLQKAMHDKDDKLVEYYSGRLKDLRSTIAKARRNVKQQGLSFRDINKDIAGLDEKIQALKNERQGIEEKYAKKMEAAKKERVKIIIKPNDFGAMLAKLRVENKAFFVKAKKQIKFLHKNPPSGAASAGGFSDVESLNKAIGGVDTIEFPELLRISKKLLGNYPILAKTMGRAIGRFYADRINPRIKIKKDAFRDPQLVAKILAHEVGHLVDFLPDKTMARGNLVGHVAVLRKYLKWTFKDLKDPELRKELQKMSQLWSPFDENNAKFRKYRYSAKELYADAISVLFNDPDLLQQTAPKFWKGFFNNLDKKPDVKAILMSTWDMIKNGEQDVLGERDKAILQMFKRGEDAFKVKRLESKHQKHDYLYKLKRELVDKNQGLIDLKNKLKKQGKTLPLDEDPTYYLDGYNYISGVLKAWTQKHIQPLYEEVGKAGMSWDDFGEYLFLQRIANERGAIEKPIDYLQKIAPDIFARYHKRFKNIVGKSTQEQLAWLDELKTSDEEVYQELTNIIPKGLANPLGFDVKTAKKQLKYMRGKLGVDKYNKLSDIAEKFRKANDLVLEKALKKDYFDKDLANQLMANPHYATFQVIDYLDTYVSPEVKTQRGTLKDITNPADATIAKTWSLLRAVERNEAKAKAIDWLERDFPDEIKPARKRWVNNHWEYIPPQDETTDLLMYKKGGEWKGYYVDKAIADSFNHRPVGSNNAVLSAIRLANNKLFRPLFITFSPGFQTFNIVRDFLRLWHNYPDRNFAEAILSFPKLLNAYRKALPHAKARGFETPDDLIAAMENNKMLSVTYNDILRGAETDEKRIEYMMSKFKNKANVKGLKKVGEFIENVGNTIETLPKVAAYSTLQDRLTPEQLAKFVREASGSPDFLKKGAGYDWVNNTLLFFNAAKEGYRTDLELAFGDNEQKYGGSKSAWWFKRVLTDIVPAVIAFYAAKGLFGDKIKKAYSKISQYNLTNYLVIPIGMGIGKVASLRVPPDEMGRLIHGLTWKTLNAIDPDKTVHEPFWQNLAEIFSYGAGQFPNITPAITVPTAIAQYLAGKNPYDFFYGKSVIPDQEFKAGGKYALVPFGKWLFNKVGGRIFMNFNVYEQAPATKTWGEKALSLPIISDTVGRWIKISNYGETEKLRKIKQQEERQRAIKYLRERKTINKYIQKYMDGKKSMTRKYSIEKEMINELMDKNLPPADQKKEAKKLIKKFNVGLVRGQSDTYANAIISATSNREKVNILDEAFKNKTFNDFKSLVRDLIKYKIISKNVIGKFQKEKGIRLLNMLHLPKLAKAAYAAEEGAKYKKGNISIMDSLERDAIRLLKGINIFNPPVVYAPGEKIKKQILPSSKPFRELNQNEPPSGKFRDTLIKSSRKYKVPTSLSAAVGWQESGYKLDAHNGDDWGAAQINLKSNPSITREQAKKPDVAGDFIPRRLRENYNYFHDWNKAVAAYNLGQERVKATPHPKSMYAAGTGHIAQIYINHVARNLKPAMIRRLGLKTMDDDLVWIHWAKEYKDLTGKTYDGYDYWDVMGKPWPGLEVIKRRYNLHHSRKRLKILHK